MATSIEWTALPGFRGDVWNPVRGCMPVSPGCKECYAMKQAHRFSGPGKPYAGLTVIRSGKVAWSGEFREVPEVLDLPLRTRRPTCYFVNSMSDLFGNGVSDEWIAAVFGVMAACPQHRFIVLTKRAERMAAWFGWIAAKPSGLRSIAHSPRLIAASEAMQRMDRRWSVSDLTGWPLPNVAIGVSVEDQQLADERIPCLLKVPAAVRFLSVEPQIGPVALLPEWTPYRATDGYRPPGVDWVIIGGESGHGARPFDVAWARSLIAQCKAAGVPAFVKQLGANVVCTFCGNSGLNDDERREDGLCSKCEDFERDAKSGRIVLASKKGGAMAEWPEDLRVRQWPEAWR